MTNKLRCFLVTKDDEGRATSQLAEKPIDDLPEGDLLIRVAYSSLNYKDALSATGHGGVTRNYPHVPGIDAAGTVAESRSAKFREGDHVLVTGFDLGANTSGGYGEYVRVPEKWVVPMPGGLTSRESMIYGTAGFTAALSLEAIQRHGIEPDHGAVVVSGASGGVGSVAVAILAKIGYHVVAVTGKQSAHDYLKKLGAAEIVARHEVDDSSGRPLLSARFAAAIDTVGGNILSTIIRSTKNAGCVTCCGLVAGAEFPITVLPFILRGMSLVGIDSAQYKIERRPAIWENLAGAWRPEELESMVADTVELERLDASIADILAGKIRGRVLVQHQNADAGG